MSFEPLRCWLRLSACLFLLACAGCSRSTEDGSGQHHAHRVDLPGHEQMQLELAVDEPRRKLVVYVLKTGTRDPNPISSKKLDITFQISGQDIPVSLDADPQPDDPAGRASRFGTDFDTLPTPIQGAGNFTATFNLKVQGQAVSGMLNHTDDHD